MINKGVLRQDGNFLLFTSDYSFSSASAAAATVIGASANGRILWKMPDGRTYGDWEASQGEPLDTHDDTAHSGEAALPQKSVSTYTPEQS
ncbi:MAG: hypothetical protein CVT86_03625 [Alphaproteobacteria bacterium HGW-Alphaproteobacteria-8]|nr:MAG: hypothetical protein CVT86_03625 [Alphaproteobacteria bacterium HGW-Alphaproteobacteria-8]